MNGWVRVQRAILCFLTRAAQRSSHELPRLPFSFIFCLQVSMNVWVAADNIRSGWCFPVAVTSKYSPTSAANNRDRFSGSLFAKNSYTLLVMFFIFLFRWSHLLTWVTVVPDTHNQPVRGEGGGGVTGRRESIWYLDLSASPDNDR